MVGPPDKITKDTLKEYRKEDLVEMTVKLNNAVAAMREMFTIMGKQAASNDIDVLKKSLSELQTGSDTILTKNVLDGEYKGLKTLQAKEEKKMLSDKPKSSKMGDDEDDETEVDSEDGNVGSVGSKDTRKAKAYRLDSNTPVFDPENKKMTIDEWLFGIKSSFRAAGVPDNLRLSVLVPYLKNSAYRKLHKLNKEKGDNASWEEFEQILKNDYRVVDHQEKLKIKLRELKQVETVEKYVSKFTSLINQIDDLSEKDQILWFKEGLQQKIKLELVTRKCETLNDAIELASRCETCLGGDKTVTVNYAGKQQHRRPFRRPLNNNRSNPIQPNSKKDMSNVECHRCHLKGHMASTCRVRLDKQQQSNQGVRRQDRRSTEQTTVKPKTKTTAVCHTQAESILSTIGTIKGVKVRMSLDCGAVESILSVNLIDRLNVELLPSDVKVKTATNEIRKVVGTTGPLEIEVEGHVCKIPFLVLDIEDHDVLLGLNWFEETGAGIFPMEKILRFPGHSIHLNRDRNVDEDTFQEIADPYVDVYVSEVIDDKDIDEEDWSDLTPPLMAPAIELKPDQVKAFEQLRVECSDIFATDYDTLGECNVREHHILVDNHVPIYTHPYRKSIAERREIEKEISKMLKAQIIRPSNSPWSSPVIMVPKKNGTKRMCIDFRKLNKVTQQVQWPLPRIQDILDRMNKSKWFSALDLKSGYWQVKMHKKSIELTAFSTPDGHYEFLRLPFGLKNAPADFSRIMYQVLGGLPFVEIYLDDITIHSKTFEEHMSHIKIVIERLRKAGLKVNAEKCTWCAKEIKLLGHVVAENSVKMDETKIQAIRDRLAPKTVKQLQQFLGLANYYRRFIKNFAEIAAPLVNLLKKDTKWEWTSDCQVAFDTLKNCLTASPILRQPDFDREFILYTDASGYALGAILAQRVSDGTEYVCAYASRAIRKSEINYGISEKECLAVVWAIKHFRIYLYGTNFKVITDHSALTWLMKITDPTARLARWAIYLQAYMFEIIHRKGNVHENVDALSRPVLLSSIMRNEDEDDEKTKILDPWDDDLLMHFLKYRKFISGISKKQRKRVERREPLFKLENDVLWYRKSKSDEYKIWPKLDERRELISNAHLVGHFQAATTYKRLNERYFWKSMMDEIVKVVKQCIPCQRHQKTRALEHKAKAIEIDGIFDQVGIDLVFGLPETEDGYCGVFVYTEKLTKFPQVYPIKSKAMDEIVPKIWDCIALFGPPKVILTDQGKEFNNQLMTELVNWVGCEHRVTSAYNPRTNGQTERFNQTLMEALRKHAEGNPTNWDKWIPYVLMAYRSRIHTVTKYSPFELMYGRKMNFFEDWNNRETMSEIESLLKRTTEIEDLKTDLRQRALINVSDGQRAQMKVQDSRAHKILVDSLKAGTPVFIKNEGILTKLEPRYIGPYKIARRNLIGNYELEDHDGNVLKTSYPIHKLKLIEEPEDMTVESWEVDQVIDSRQKNNMMEYLVRWKNCPESDNSWVKESHFNSMEPITEYHKAHKRVLTPKRRGRPPNQHKKKPVETESTDSVIEKPRRRRGRPPKSTFLLTIQAFFMMFTLGLCTTVRGNFKYCDHLSSMNTILDINKSCSKNLNWNFGNLSKSLEFSILTRNRHLVYGKGYQCRITEKDYSFTKTFFGNEYTSTFERHITVTRAECELMVKTKKCKETVMNCDGENCVVEFVPTYEHSWLRTINKRGYICVVNTRVINGDSKSSKLFESQIHPCTADLLECRMLDSIIIWESSIIHDCPYQYVDTMIFNYSVNSQTLLFNDKLLVQLEGDWFFDCNMQLIKSTEGFYLTRYTKAKGLQKALETPSLASSFSLSENDLISFENRVKILKLEKRFCLMLLTVVNTVRDDGIKIFNIFDREGNDLVLVNNEGVIFVPQCVAITDIEILEGNRCFKDLAIRFRINDTLISAFLTVNNIISRVSKEEKCEISRKKYLINNTLISVFGRRIKVLELSTSNFKSLNLIENNYSSWNFKHSNHILEGNDIIKIVHDLNEITEAANDKFLIDGKPLEIISSDSNLDSSAFLLMFKSLKFHLILFFYLIVCITITVSCLKFKLYAKFLIGCGFIWINFCRIFKSAKRSASIPQEIPSEVISGIPENPASNDNNLEIVLDPLTKNILADIKQNEVIEI